MSRVTCASLVASYNGTAVLRGVDLVVQPGEFVAVIGPNGAGKTTLLRCIAGVMSSSEGHVDVDGLAMDRANRKAAARSVAVVPQSPVVPGGITVFDYVLLGRNPHVGLFANEAPTDFARVNQILSRLDLEVLASRSMTSLSGGERQRAVLGRAIAQDAGVLLLDEPTSALDLAHQVQVLELVDELRHDQNIAVIAAIHDLTLAARYADRLVMLVEGVVVAEGIPQEVLTRDLLRRYYEADVVILSDEDGELVVAPRRPQPATNDSKAVPTK